MTKKSYQEICQEEMKALVDQADKNPLVISEGIQIMADLLEYLGFEELVYDFFSVKHKCQAQIAKRRPGHGRTG